MRVRNRAIVVIGRTLALMGALALGTAVALAQAPASPNPNSEQPDQATSNQSDDNSQQDQNKEQSESPRKSSDSASKNADDNRAQSEQPANPNRSQNTGDRSQDATETDTPAPRSTSQDPAAGQRRTTQQDSQQPAANRNQNRRSGQQDQDADQPARRGQPDDARGRGQRGADPADQTRGGQRRDRAGQRRDPADGTAVRRDDARDDQGRDGERRRAGLGIEFDQQVQDGIAISNIRPESNAARAGLQPGDRIVSVDGREFRNPRQFQAYVSGQFGRPVPMIIERNGQRYSIQLPAMEASQSGPWLGVYLQDAEDQQQGQTGARITNVFPSGPAARAGLRPGDVITQINGEQVQSTPDLIAMIDNFQPRDRVQFMVQRGEQDVEIPAVLGSRENFVYFRQGQQGQDAQQENEFDEFSGVPPYAMSLEHDRRMAEQHQRIETELQKLQEEVRQLRELISNQRQN